MWKTLMVLALSGAGTALACDLDDCDLATELHLERAGADQVLSLIHISEPTRPY